MKTQSYLAHRLQALTGLFMALLSVIASQAPRAIEPSAVSTVFPANAGPGCAGTLDPSFAAPEEFPHLWSSYPPILAMNVQADGKAVIADGTYDPEKGGLVYSPPIRFNPDGSLDTGYVSNPADVTPHTRVLLPDGKRLELAPGSNGAAAQLVRFNADGTQDLGFKAALPEGFMPTVVALQPNGLVLVGGGVLCKNRLDEHNTRYWKAQPVARLYHDGSLDAGFCADLTFDLGPPSWNSHLADYIHDMVVDADGRIYISGFFTRINGLRRTNVARLNADGTLDLAFEPDIDVCVGCDIDARETVSALGLTPDGKLIIAGKLTRINGLERHALARLHTRDESCAGVISFAAERFTVSETNALTAVTVRRGGDTSQKLSVRYQTYTNDYFTLPEAVEWSDYQPTAGTLDFAPGETVKTILLPLQKDPLVEPNERISLSLSNPTGGALLRTPVQVHVLILDDDAAGRPGNVDISFQPDLNGFTAWNSVRALATDAGSIWVAGLFDQVDGILRNGFARLHLDGRLMTNFNPVLDGPVMAFAADLSGSRMLVGGKFTKVDGFAHYNLVRFNADGMRDETFNAPDYGAVSVIQVQSDGRILNGGDSGVARLNADGSVDPTFNQGSTVAVDGNIYALAMQSDGKIVLGGFFYHVHQQRREDLARLNADGSLDASFNPTAVPIELMVCVYDLAAQADGRILVGGFFNGWQGENRAGLVRLNPDGSLDTKFNPGRCGIVHDLVLQSDGAILIAASPYAALSSPNRAVMRLLPDGTVDGSFFVGWVEDSFGAFRLAVQPNGDVLVGGSFQEANSLPYPWLARLHGNLTGVHANNPGSLSFSAPVYRVDENGGTATITVQRLWGSQGAVSARLTTRDDTAAAGADYVASTALITFAAGDAMGKTITIPILDDLAGDGDETVRLDLGDVTGGATLGSYASAPLTIVENDLVFEFESPIYYVSEANTQVQVWIQLRGKRGIPARVEYATQDGTAQAGLDYVAKSDAWTFHEAGYGLLPSITLSNDARIEGNETFTVTLRNPTGGAILGSNHTATVVIVDDELMPWVSRELPSAYLPGVRIYVRLNATPAPNSRAYAVEDQPPASWSVTNISHGGVWDANNGKVKFGPFFDNTPRLLTYYATAPACDGATRSFTGAASSDGLSTPISGNAQIVCVTTALTDTDQDGLPDCWEQAGQLSVINAADAAIDSDNDKMNNLAEFGAGTDPQDSNSVLRLELIPGNPAIGLQFMAMAGFEYEAQYNDFVGATNWQRLTWVNSSVSNRVVTVEDGAVEPMRFYRVQVLPETSLSLSHGDTGQLRFTALAGYVYAVEYRDDLFAGSWTPLEYVLNPTTDTVTVTDPDATQWPMRAYRLRRLD